MSEIKSALELALERTADVKGDKGALEAHENRQAGQRILSEYLEDPELDIKKRLKTFDGKKRDQVRRGLFDSLLGNITLPADETQLERIKSLQPAFEAVLNDKRSIPEIYDQLLQLLQQYLRDRQQLIEQLRQQFEGRIRQREEEVARQTGQRVRLDPSQDPEFSKTLQEHMQQLTGQYQQVIDQAREQIQSLY